jgi:hypothetical protein
MPHRLAHPRSFAWRRFTTPELLALLTLLARLLGRSRNRSKSMSGLPADPSGVANGGTVAPIWLVQHRRCSSLPLRHPLSTSESLKASCQMRARTWPPAHAASGGRWRSAAARRLRLFVNSSPEPHRPRPAWTRSEAPHIPLRNRTCPPRTGPASRSGQKARRRLAPI